MATLGSGAVLVAWRDEERAALPWRARDGERPIRPPYARLTLRGGGSAAPLQLLYAPLPSAGRLRLERGDGAVGLAVDLHRAPPLAVGDLARSLSRADQHRLALWLLNTGAGVMRLAAEPELAHLVRELLPAVLPPAGLGAAQPLCRLPGGRTLFAAELEADRSRGRLDAFLLGAAGGLQRALIETTAPTTRAGPRALGVFEDARPSEPCLLVLLGPRGLSAHRLSASRGSLPDAAAWLASVTDAGDGDARLAALGLVATLAERPGGERFAALIDELLRLVPPPAAVRTGDPGATLVAAGHADRQLVLLGELSDPERQVRSILLRQPGAMDVEIGRPDLVFGGAGRHGCRFVAAVPASSRARLPWRAHLVLRSGAELAIGEIRTPASAADALAKLLAAGEPFAAIPAAWPLLEPVIGATARSRAAGWTAKRVERLGPPLLRPRASLVLPFRAGEDVVRLARMLDAEPAGASVELVLVALAPDPSLVAAAHKAAGFRARSIRVVLPELPLPTEGGALMGIASAEAPVVLVAGPCIAPRVGGWLAALLEAVAIPDPGDPGVALAGLPLAGPGSAGPLPSLSALVALRCDALQAVGGIAGDWLDPGHRDADLALRLLAAGYRVRMLAGPYCVRTGPSPASAEAELAVVLDRRRLAAHVAARRLRHDSGTAEGSNAGRVAVAG